MSGEASVEEVVVEATTVEEPGAAKQYEEVVVACVQRERLRIYATWPNTGSIYNTLRIAQHKHAQLVVFPELAGIMSAPFTA